MANLKSINPIGRYKLDAIIFNFIKYKSTFHSFCHSFFLLAAFPADFLVGRRISADGFGRHCRGPRVLRAVLDQAPVGAGLLEVGVPQQRVLAKALRSSGCGLRDGRGLKEESINILAFGLGAFY